MNQRVEHIQSEIIRLSSECTSKTVFTHQFGSIIKNRKLKIDMMIVLYYYLYNVRQYLFQVTPPNYIDKFIDKSKRLLDELKDVDETISPKLMVDMARFAISQMIDIMNSYLITRIRLL